MSESIVVVGPDSANGARFDRLKPQRVRSPEEIRNAFERAGRVLWIVTRASDLRPIARSSARPRSGMRLLVLDSIGTATRELLRALFGVVVARDASVKLLPVEEMVEVLASPNCNDLFVGGVADPEDGALVLYRGNLEPLVVPLSWFKARRGGPHPDASAFEVTDYGQTVRLGEYEAAADAILYEFDVDARRRLKKRLVAEDSSLGGSIRRLRLQKGLRRDDFGDISSKEIARIERGEVARPRSETLDQIAEALGVEPEELGSF